MVEKEDLTRAAVGMEKREGFASSTSAMCAPARPMDKAPLSHKTQWLAVDSLNVTRLPNMALI